MSDLNYPDRCVITRDSDNIDEFGNIIMTEIYNGVCDSQPSGISNQSVIVYSDVVYLPGAVMTEDNDHIEITTATNSQRKGIVRKVNDLGLSLTGEYVTEIEVIQNTEQ